MEDDYDEYRRWDGDVDVEVCFVLDLIFNSIFLMNFEIVYILIYCFVI